ncbi:hypothetical protein B0F90DRAFT_1814753 [Multifurca ochricompacta]|uniref:Uncharacterized protein n=1 Tax=Multifurca ochricompacta TaxID=376703 RepID=A0AAD4MB37_9AGAM|nr:hypothetical protein B0F90DRAFT_1814753 [Multifurca ochricompacta]
MSLSSVAAAFPRPILKHSSQSYLDYSTKDKSLSLSLSVIPRQCRNTVHFPPSPTLTRTFFAYSSSAYDRSPIVVLPNTCALPARGCPGRTYIPGCTASSPPNSSPNSHTHKTVMKAKGKHMHPRRALGLGLGSEPTPDRTTTSSVIPPPLVPDLSSESDESDGFTSSPPEFDMTVVDPNPLTFLPFASLPNLNIGESLFHSPESPDEEERQYHTYEEEKRRRRKRDRDRDRGKGGREQCPRQRSFGRDMSTRDLERKLADSVIGEELEEDDEAEDDDIGECRYKSFYSGTSLRGCGLDADGDACLAGF